MDLPDPVLENSGGDLCGPYQSFNILRHPSFGIHSDRFQDLFIGRCCFEPHFTVEPVQLPITALDLAPDLPANARYACLYALMRRISHMSLFVPFYGVNFPAHRVVRLFRYIAHRPYLDILFRCLTEQFSCFFAGFFVTIGGKFNKGLYRPVIGGQFDKIPVDFVNHRKGLTGRGGTRAEVFSFFRFFALKNLFCLPQYRIEIRTVHAVIVPVGQNP